MIKRNCQQCNKEFVLYPCERETRKFCSYDCYWKFKMGKKTGLNKKSSETMKGLLRDGKLKSRIFKKGHIPWNKDKKLPQISNRYKGKGNPMYGKHSWNYKRDMNDYPQIGFQKGHPNYSPTGKDHYRWNPNREELLRNERNDPEYKQWVKKVKKRDKNTCRINNKDCSGYCVVHHILSWSEYPELRYDINNGITLCQAHHPRKRAEEKRLVPFFKELVLVSS